MPDGSTLPANAAASATPATLARSKERAEKILQRFEPMKSERSTIEGLWEELARYILPRKSGVTTQATPGGRRGHELFDSTAIHSNEIFAGALHGMFTNPSAEWFGLRIAGAPMSALGDRMKEWLQFAAQDLHDAFNASGLSGYLQELYIDLGCFGTTAIYLDADAQGNLRFRAPPLGEIWIGESNLGVVDTLFRRFQFTARVAAQEFGIEALPPAVRDQALDPKKQDEKSWYVHACHPRTDGRASALRSTELPIANCYVHEDSRTIVMEDGYHEMPWAAPRWLKEAGGVYGRSPGMTALPDVKMINEMSKTTLRAAQKLVDPPMMMPDDGFLNPLRSGPAGINYYRAGTQDRIAPIESTGSGNVQLGLAMEDQRRNAIRNAFFVDRFNLIEGPQMTAYEVAERQNEKLKLLGPMLGRLERELLRPLIVRAFGLRRRAGRIPPPPSDAGAQGRRIEIEYLSPLAKLQRQAAQGNTRRWIMERLEIAKVTGDPSALDIVDFDEAGVHGADVEGVPQTIVRDKDAVAELRQKRAERQQADQELMAAQAAAGAAKDGSAAVNNMAQAEAAGQSPERARKR